MQASAVRALVTSSMLVMLCCMLVATLACSSKKKGVGAKVEDHSQYLVESQFNVQSDFGDSSLGRALDDLKDMSDDPDDPGRFIIEKMIGFLPTPFDSLAEGLVDELAADVNAQIVGTVPAVDELKRVADGLSDSARVFTIDSYLDLGLDSKGRFTGAHNATRITFVPFGQPFVLEGSDLGNLPITERIAIKRADGELDFPMHRLSMPMGTALRKVLDGHIVPHVSPDLLSFAQFVALCFACADITATVSEELGGGEAAVLAACLSASDSVANQLYDRLAEMDQDSGLLLSGVASVDGTDPLAWTGSGWSGGYILAEGEDAPLDPATCTFTLTQAAPDPAPEPEP